MQRKPRQLTFEKVNGWGGKRRGAGRPNLSGSVNHMKRTGINWNKPLNLTLKLNKGVPNIRKRVFLKGFKTSIRGAKEYGVSVIHYSLLKNHIHMIVEAKDNLALGRGMRSLAGRYGKFIRKIADVPIKGSVFIGRYHMHVLKTPTEMKNALEYVLLNQAKHTQLVEHIDAYSSADQFSQWQKLLGKRFRSLIQDQIETYASTPSSCLSQPKSWLCRQGWTRACH
jgi:putative transposase